jgi:rhomboid protease GluP
MNDPSPSPSENISSLPESPEVIPPARPPQATVILPRSTPLVTYVILGVTILAFALQLLGQYLFGVDVLMAYGIKSNQLIQEGQFWRLITPVLLHGSILHIAFNMYALVSLGRSVEQFFGHGRFLALYLLAGFTGNVFSFAMSPNPSLGSSTAVFGLLAAEGVFIYQNRRFFGSRFQAIFTQIVLIAVVNLFIGFTASSGIDNWGHLGGLVGGFLFTWYGGPIWGVNGAFPNFTVGDERSRMKVWQSALMVIILSVVALLLIIMYRLKSY